MNKKIEYNLELKSVKSFNKPADLLEAVRLHCDLLPEYMPMKWGWYEPLKQEFDSSHIEKLLENSHTSNVYWKRTGKNKAEGGWSKRWKSIQGLSDSTHATIQMDVYESTLQNKLLSYLKAACLKSIGDIAFLDSLSEQYKSEALASHYSQSGGHLYLTTHTLRHWLPDMPWGVVFGSAYVRMFGKKHLLTCPAYKVEDIGEEMVFIQLTPNMEDIHTKYEEVMQARAIAKRHLGEECFFKPELAYDYKVSAFTNVTEEDIAAKQGKVFRVPSFELEPD